jgi:GNAT superfamily N-acetyltransferase
MVQGGSCLGSIQAATTANWTYQLIRGRKLWRLTCFFVDRDFRKKGVAGVALRAALDSIQKQGGGIVEAYPPTSKEGGSWALWFGTVAMFEREGFKAHAKLGEKHLLMRKTLA